jgi:hypothetical protein
MTMTPCCGSLPAAGRLAPAQDCSSELKPARVRHAQERPAPWREVYTRRHIRASYVMISLGSVIRKKFAGKLPGAVSGAGPCRSAPRDPCKGGLKRNCFVACERDGLLARRSKQPLHLAGAPKATTTSGNSSRVECVRHRP